MQIIIDFEINESPIYLEKSKSLMTICICIAHYIKILFCAAHMRPHMRVRINERAQVNMRTAYDICGAIENLISNPFESPHSCLHGSMK
jgi:hypothetical protein